jgi:hypothetical protein
MNHKKVPEITKNYINILTTTYKPPLNIMTSLTWHIVSAVGYCRTRESSRVVKKGVRKSILGWRYPVEFVESGLGRDLAPGKVVFKPFEISKGTLRPSG